VYCCIVLLQHLEALEEVRRAQLLRKEQAREQAYLARMREREEQEHLARQQLLAAEGYTDPDAASSSAAAADGAVDQAAAPTEEDGGNRKRRRAPVDYAALDRELRDQTAGQPM
jgi:hypothetical protein